MSRCELLRRSRVFVSGTGVARRFVDGRIEARAIGVRNAGRCGVDVAHRRCGDVIVAMYEWDVNVVYVRDDLSSLVIVMMMALGVYDVRVDVLVIVVSVWETGWRVNKTVRIGFVTTIC